MYSPSKMKPAYFSLESTICPNILALANYTTSYWAIIDIQILHEGFDRVRHLDDSMIVVLRGVLLLLVAAVVEVTLVRLGEID